MSGRILTEKERETLEKLKNKEKFERSLVKAIEKTVEEYIINREIRSKDFEKEVKTWFLEESEYWKKINLTEYEFDYAWRKQEEIVAKRIQKYFLLQ